MHLACVSGNIRVVKLLADRSADFSAIDGRGKGCLQLAEENWVPLFRWLTRSVVGLPRTTVPGVLKKDRGLHLWTEANKPTNAYEAQQDWEWDRL